MTSNDLEFHIAQVESLITQCRSKFQTSQKEQIYSNRIQLFNSIASSKYENFDIVKLKQSSFLLNFIAREIEFLDFKSKKEIPYKLIQCLNLILEDWIDDKHLFTIAFSSNSKNLTDYYTPVITETTLKSLNHVTESLGLNFVYEYGLIQISQPRFFINDFLSSIPTYHELGHFIDNNYGISEHASSKLPKNLSKHPIVNSEKQRKDYLAEHFANIFAAQYLAELIIEKINFTSFGGKNDQEYSAHPSIEKRISIINTFLTNSGPDEDLEIINQLKESTKIKTGMKSFERELINRKIELTQNPFMLDKKVKLNASEELHSLFIEGWNSFYNSEKFKIRYPEPIKRLKRINKLIEQTIDSTMKAPNYFGLSTILPRHWLP